MFFLASIRKLRSKRFNFGLKLDLLGEARTPAEKSFAELAGGPGSGLPAAHAPGGGQEGGGRPEGHNAPPLETYTTTTTENGDVVCATPEYIRWFLRAYPAAGPENRLSRATPRSPVEGMGGKQSPLSHLKAT